MKTTPEERAHHKALRRFSGLRRLALALADRSKKSDTALLVAEKAAQALENCQIVRDHVKRLSVN